MLWGELPLVPLGPESGAADDESLEGHTAQSDAGSCATHSQAGVRSCLQDICAAAAGTNPQ